MEEEVQQFSVYTNILSSTIVYDIFICCFFLQDFLFVQKMCVRF